MENELKGIWKDKGPFIKILLLVGLIFVLMTLFTMLASFLTNFFYGIDVMTDRNVLEDYSRPEVMNSLKLIQIVTSFGIFLLPPVLAAYLISYNPVRFLKLDKVASPAVYLLGVLALIVSLPLINYAISLNEQMNLPVVFKGVEDWMRGAEAKAAELTQAFLNTTTTQGLLLNIFMVAVIPAIGEELFFRGYLQRIFREWLKNIHVAIILTAIIFSTFHMQFFGFLPRVVLGMMLGYLFYWSKSLWVPIVAHFFNNAAAVIIAFLYYNGYISFDGNELGTGDDYLLPVLVSVIFTSAVMYIIYRRQRVDYPL